VLALLKNPPPGLEPGSYPNQLESADSDWITLNPILSDIRAMYMTAHSPLPALQGRETEHPKNPPPGLKPGSLGCEPSVLTS
jgi:hypothetical protein